MADDGDGDPQVAWMAACNGDGEGGAPVAWGGSAENPASLTWDRDCGCSGFEFSRGPELTGGSSPVSGDVLARLTVAGHFSSRIYQTGYEGGWLTAWLQFVPNIPCWEMSRNRL